METQEERGQLMETDGGAKGAAGGRQTPEGCLPAAWHQGPLPVEHPLSEGSATHTCSGGQVWQASRQRRCSSPKPGVRQPRAGCGPHTSPSPGSADSNPPFAASCSPRRRALWGAGRTRVGRGHAPRLAHTHRGGCSRRAGTVCSAAASPPALAGSPPSSRALSAHKRSLARPLVHTRAPRSSSQVARPCHLPPCQNRSAPAPDPDHSRHPASSLKFWNSAGRNSGRLDRSERGHAPAGRRSEEDKGHTRV